LSASQLKTPGFPGAGANQSGMVKGGCMGTS
jgi:hypothetical protein